MTFGRPSYMRARLVAIFTAEETSPICLRRNLGSTAENIILTAAEFSLSRRWNSRFLDLGIVIIMFGSG